MEWTQDRGDLRDLRLGCLAAHLNPAFREKVIELVGHAHDVVPGIDHDPRFSLVLDECRAVRAQNVSLAVVLSMVLATTAIATYLVGSANDPGARESLPWVLAVAAMISVLTVYLFRRRDNQAIRRLFTSGGFLEFLETKSGMAGKTILDSESARLYLYRGKWNPFSDSGHTVATWSASFDLTKPVAIGKTPAVASVDPGEIMSALTQCVEKFGLKGVTVEEVLCAPARSISKSPSAFRSNAPGTFREVAPTSIPKASARSYASADYASRLFTRIVVPLWDGDARLSIYLRATRQGTMLFTEVHAYVSLPIDDGFVDVDRLRSWPSDARRAEDQALTILAPFFMCVAPLLLLGATLSSINAASVRAKRDRAREKEYADSAPTYSFYTDKTIRSDANSFLNTDILLTWKCIETSIVDTVIRYLEDKGISAQNLKEARESITNNGILIQADTLSSEVMTIGHGSKAVVNEPERAKIKVEHKQDQRQRVGRK